MSDTPEPLAAVLAEMRGLADHRAADAGGERPAVELLRSYADRIEAAAEREREINQKILAAANDANAILKDDCDRAIQFANAAPHPGSVSWKEMHEVYTKARAILSAVQKEGNAAAMREALEWVAEFVEIGVDDEYSTDGQNLAIAAKKARAALAEPARNCDRPECADVESAWATYCAETNRADCKGFARWLFAPAQEGGDHA